jgi:hypothetical protein
MAVLRVGSKCSHTNFVCSAFSPPRASRGVPNLNVETGVPLSFTAFGRVIKPPAMRVVVYLGGPESRCSNQ